MKSLIHTLLISLIAAVVLLSGVAEGQSDLQRQAEAEDNSLIVLSSKLEKFETQAVIEYSGKCFRPSVIIAVPVVLNESPTRNKDVVTSVRDVLSKDKRFTVKANKDGILTIAEARVRQDFLDLRIPEVVFTKEQQYNPQEAMRAVVNTPEVKTYMKQHGISVENSWGGLVNGTGAGFPHLSVRIENQSVLDIIKTILRTFPRTTHLAVYRECSTSNERRIVGVTFK